jgi:hypothetical protein
MMSHHFLWPVIAPWGSDAPSVSRTALAAGFFAELLVLGGKTRRTGG